VNTLKDMLKLTGLPVLVASLCCLAPVVLVAAGVSTVAFGISLTNILDGQYKWAFQLAGALALAVSLVMYFRKRGVCTLDQAKKHRNEIINKTLLALIVGLVGYHLFFNIFLTWAGVQLKLWG
jgi:hypothetical protein